MLWIGLDREVSVDKKDTLEMDDSLDLVGFKINPNLKEGSSILETIFVTCLSDLKYYSTWRAVARRPRRTGRRLTVQL